MRTTVTLEPDVALKLKKRVSREKISFKDAVNQALRIGLAADEVAKPRFRVETHDFGFKAGIDLDKLNQLLDEMESEEIIRKMRSHDHS